MKAETRIQPSLRLQLEHYQEELADLDHEDLSPTQLGTSSSVHDRTQFESKFDFDIVTDRPDDWKSYEVDMFVFLPGNAGLTSSSYPRDAFYGDLQHLLRVRTPEMEQRDGPDSAASCLASADEYFRSNLDTQRRGELHERVVHDVKLFGCVVYTKLKRLQTTAYRVTQRGLVQRWNGHLPMRLELLYHEILEFRKNYVWRVKNDALLIDEEVRRTFLLVDEYLSYRLEAALVNLHRLLESHRSECGAVYAKLQEILLGEVAYRNDHIEAARSRKEARVETHYHRLGLLKKHVSEVLFLRSKRINKDGFYRTSTTALGAAVAMTAATVVNMLTVEQAVGGKGLSLRLFFVLFLGVVIYAFRDVIKDVVKDHFNRKIKALLPDFEIRMFWRHFDKKGKRRDTYLGMSRETVRYLTSKSIPDEIAYVRNLGNSSELEPERLENVIHYNKKVNFDARGELREQLANAKVRRIHDVLRFDVSRFLAKFDDPKKRLSYFDAQAVEVVTIEAPKVYHINLIFRYTSFLHREGTTVRQEVELERLRMVLNKKGIVRIETVLPRGELGFLDSSEG